MRSQFALSLLLLLASLFRTDASRAEPKFALELPRPSGGLAIGRVSYDWTDQSRLETLSSDANVHRELMVYIWYPAAPEASRAIPAPYFPGASVLDKSPQAQEFIKGMGASWPLIVSGKIQTHTVEDAPIANGRARFPLLVFSHGGGAPSFTYTSQIEDLVSHGYVVAAIEHTYEDGAVAFPDGRVIPLSSKSSYFWRHLTEKGAHDWEQQRDDEWARDISFVLAQVTRFATDQSFNAPFLRRVDLSRVGAFGHSIGGRAVARACELEPRIKACVNEDGYLTADGPILAYDGARPPTQPFMFIQQFRKPPSDKEAQLNHYTREDYERDMRQFEPTATKELEGCTGGSYWVTLNLPGFDHYSFTDLHLIRSVNSVETANAARSLQTIRSYLMEFFDKYLKGKDEPLLQQTSSKNNLVEIKSYGKAKLK